jgi:hypothetical protein
VLRPDRGLEAWIAAQRDRGAVFFVVDEGPGLSGSSLLAVAEALMDARVEPRRIHLLGTRAPDLRTLIGRDAARRFAVLAGLSVQPPAPPPEEGAQDLSLGAGRARPRGGLVR